MSPSTARLTDDQVEEALFWAHKRLLDRSCEHLAKLTRLVLAIQEGRELKCHDFHAEALLWDLYRPTGFGVVFNAPDDEFG